MNLLALNYDVKCLVLDRLDQSDLSTLCLTNSDLYRNVRPILYSSVRLRVVSRISPRLQCLLRTVLSKPELAAYIRNLSITTGWDFGSPKEPQVPESDVDFICNFGQSIGLPDAHDWVQDLRRGRMEAYLAVLLLNLPSVRFLNIIPRKEIFISGRPRIPGSNCHYLGQALRILRGENSANDAQRITGSLQNLEQMSCMVDKNVSEHPTPTFSHHTAHLLHLFYLPALKRLPTHVYIDPVPLVDFPWPAATPPCAVRLEFLSIAQLHELHLGPILSSAPNLQTLHWNRGRQPSEDWESVNLQYISTALGQVKKTLKELRIFEYEQFEPGSNDLDQFQGPLRSLSLVELDEITVLDIPIMFVMEHSSRTIQMNHFPPNVQILTLATNYTRVDFGNEVVYFNAMSRWLEADAKRETPYLKKLNFVTPVRERELQRGSREALQRLREAIALVGIEFAYYDHKRNWHRVRMSAKGIRLR